MSLCKNANGNSLGSTFNLVLCSFSVYKTIPTAILYSDTLSIGVNSGIRLILGILLGAGYMGFNSSFLRWHSN